MRHLHTVCALAFALALLALPGAAGAKAKPRPAPEPTLDERAAQVLDKACKALTGMKEFGFQAQVTLDLVHQDGSKIQTGRQMTVTVQRPGAFKVVTDADDIQAVTAFDGKTFTLALPGRKLYGRIDAALDTDALMDMRAASYGIESPLGDLLSNAPCAKLSGAADGYYIGKAKVDGAVCDHLFFQGRDVDWQIWVEDSPAALPRKLVITEKKLPSAPQFSAVLGAWKTGPLDKDALAYAPPADYSRDDAVITGGASARK